MRLYYEVYNNIINSVNSILCCVTIIILFFGIEYAFHILFNFYDIWNVHNNNNLLPINYNQQIKEVTLCKTYTFLK